MIKTRRGLLTLASMLFVLCVAAAIIWACGGDNKTPYEEEQDDEGDDQADDDSGDTTPPDPPIVDPVTSPTPLDVQSITGTAEPDADIEVRGGDGNAAAKADSASGEWCATVSLNDSAANDLEITATDAADNVSAPTYVTIVQDPSSGPEDENRSPEGLPVAASTSTSECPECTPDKGIDGDMATWWRNSTNTLTNPEEANRYPQWYMVNLLEPHVISRVVIIWEDVMYATSYVIAYSQLSSPPYPHDNMEEPNWYTVYVNQMGTGGTENIMLDEPINARWVAIVLYGGNDINELTQKPRYAVSEYELWGFPEDEQPVDPGCD